MGKRDDIMKIWQESFKDPRSYVAMYFDRVYRDDEAMLLTDPSGAPVSSLLLQQYSMTFHGSTLPVGYIAGAATRRMQRGKGYMSRLMDDALKASAARGDMLCALIPATEALYWFYRRYGFSTVFYTKEQRFTALHPFPVKEEYGDGGTMHQDDLWSAFDRFQHIRPCYVVHTRRQFENILADNEADGGDFVVVTRDNPDSGPEIVSMAWAVGRDDLILVKDLMGVSEDARTAAMRRLRQLHPGVPFLLYGRPGDTTGGRLMPRAMARVVNASLLLGAVAASQPRFRCRVRVTDHMLPEINSHTYILEDGVCTIDDGLDADRLDFDVTSDVLADIAFSSPKMGEILRFPSERPMISLMLD
ncbi:MAG: GNAT family N-acetyltransferase [Muribaculaceae bacterium]|nr:GNAT family N-acetyltransferase [Muribaculaceae bacterium]